MVHGEAVGDVIAKASTFEWAFANSCIETNTNSDMFALQRVCSSVKVVPLFHAGSQEEAANLLLEAADLSMFEQPGRAWGGTRPDRAGSGGSKPPLCLKAGALFFASGGR